MAKNISTMMSTMVSSSEKTNTVLASWTNLGHVILVERWFPVQPGTEHPPLSSLGAASSISSRSCKCVIKCVTLSSLKKQKQNMYMKVIFN